MNDKKVGRFMVGVGAIIEHVETNTILLIKRSEKLPFNPGLWETVFGRVDQGESAQEGLLREIEEEIGKTDVTILRPFRDFHIYRGEEIIENELIGMVFYAQANTQEVNLSNEHSEYQWVPPEESLSLVTQPGIQSHFEAFVQMKRT